MEWCNLSLCKRPISDKIPVPPSEDALPIGALPSWSRLPYDAKIPILCYPDDVLEFVKPRVGEKLFKSYPNKEFELLDPYMHFLPGRYDSLNDPYLKYFFRSSFHFKQMVKKGFITNEGKVRCTLAEFNQYRLYLYQIWAMEVNQLRRQQMSEVREKIKQNRMHKRTKDDSFSPFSKRKKRRLLHTSDVESDWEWQNNLYDENYGSEMLIQKEIKDMELHQRGFQKKIEKGYRYQYKAIEDWLNEETRHIRNVAENEKEKQRKREKQLTSTWERRYCNSQTYMEKELEIRNRYDLLLKVREEKRKLNIAKQWRKDSCNLLLLKKHQRRKLWQQYDEVQKRFEKMHYEDEQWDLFDDIYSSFWDVEESLNDTESSFENLGKEERTFDQRLEDIVMDKKPRKHSQESKKRKEVTKELPKELLKEKDDIALPKNKAEKKRRRISFKVEDNDYSKFKSEIMDKLSSSNIPDRLSEPKVSMVEEEAKSSEESSHPHISQHSLDTDLSAVYTQVTPVKESISKLSQEYLLNHKKRKSYDASSNYAKAHDIVSKSDIHERSSLPDSVPDHTFLSKSSVEMHDHQSFDSSKIPLFSMPSQRSFSKSDRVVQVLELADDKSDENDLHTKERFKSSESNRDEISNNVCNGVQEPELKYDQVAEKEEKEEYISKSNASTPKRVISDELPSLSVYITPQPSPKLSKTEISININKKLSFDKSEEKLETDEQLTANDVKTKLSTAYLVPDSSQSKKESEEHLNVKSLQDYKDHQLNFVFRKEYYDETSKYTHVNERGYNVSYFIGEQRQTNFVKEQEGSKRALTIAESKSPFNEHLTKDAKSELSVPYMKSDSSQPKNVLEKNLNSECLQSFQFPPIDLPSQNIVYEESLEHKSIPATGRSNETSSIIGIHFDLSEDSITLAKVTNKTRQKDSYLPTEFPKKFTTDQSKMFQDKKPRKASRKSDGRIILQAVPKDYKGTSFLSLHFDKKDFQFPDISISKTADFVDQNTFLQYQQEDNSVYDRSIEAVGKLESPSTQDFLHPTILSKMQNYNWQKIASSVDKKICAFPKLAVQQSFQPLHAAKRELKSNSTSKLLIHDATFQDTEMDLQSKETILQLPKFKMKEHTIDKPTKVNVEEQNHIIIIQPDQVLSAVENMSPKLRSENILCELPLTDSPFKDRDIDYLSNQELLYPTSFPPNHGYPLEKISKTLDKNMNQIVKKPSEVDTKETHQPSFVEKPFSIVFDKDYKFNIEKKTSGITKELQITPFPKFHDLFFDHNTSADKSINNMVQKKQTGEHHILGSVAENIRSLNDIDSESREWKAEVIQPFATLQLDKESPVNISEVEPKTFSISESKQELSDKDFMLLHFPESYGEKKLSYTNAIKMESLHDKMSFTMKGNESVYNEQPVHVSTGFPQDIDMKPETSSEQMPSSPEISEQNVFYKESIDSSESKDAIRIFAEAYQDTRKSIELYETLSNFDESKLKNFYSYNISDKEAESNSLKSRDSFTQSIYTENQTSLPSVCPSSVVTDSSEKMYDIPDIINGEVRHSTIETKYSNSETLYKSSEQLYSNDIRHSVENVQEMYYPLQSENVNGNYDIKNFPFICSLSDFTYVSNEISPLECTETMLDNAANFLTVIPHDILIDSIPQICNISVNVNQQLTPYSEFIGISDDDISEDFAILSGSVSNPTLDNISNITLESDPTLDMPELFVECMKQSISEQKTSDLKKDFNQIRLSSISYDSSENLGGSLSSSILAQDDFSRLRYERSVESKETFGASIPPPEFSGKEYFAKDEVVEISHIQESDDKLPFDKEKEKVVPSKYFKTFDRQLAEDISDAKRKEVSVLVNMLSGVSIADAFKELKSDSFVQNASTVNFTSDTGLQRTCSRTFVFTELQAVASKEHLSAIQQLDGSECLEELYLPKGTQIKREQLSTTVKLNNIDDTSLSDNYSLKKTIQQLKVKSSMEVLPVVSSEYFKNLADSLCVDDKVKDTGVGFLEKDNFAINILPELSQKADLFKFNKSPDEVPWLKPCSALDSSQVVDLDVFAPTTHLIGVDKKREFVSSAYSRTRADSSYTEDKVKETSIGYLEKDHFTINILPPFSQQIDDLVKMDKRSEGITLQKTYSAPGSDQAVDSEYFLPTQHITGDEAKQITSLVKLLSDITVTSAFDELQKDSQMVLHNENFVPSSVSDFSRDLQYVSKEKIYYEQKLSKYINAQLLSFDHYSYDTTKDSAKVEKADIELEQFKPLSQLQLNAIHDKTDQVIESFSLQIPEIEKKYYQEEKALDSELQSDVNILASETIAEAFGELQTEDNLYDEEIMDIVSKGELSDWFATADNAFVTIKKGSIEPEEFKSFLQPQLEHKQDKAFQATEFFSLQIPRFKKEHQQQYRKDKTLKSELLSDVNILASLTISEAFEELQTEDTVYDQRLKDLDSKSQLSNSFVSEGNKIIPVKEEVVESEQFESFSQSQLDDVQVKALQAIESFSLQIPRAERERIQQYRKEQLLESEMLSDVNLLASLTIAEAFEELQTEDTAYDERVKDLDSKSQLSNLFASADNIYAAFEEKGVKLKQFKPLSGLRLNDTQSKAFQVTESFSFNLPQVESDQQYRNKLESELLTDVNMLANITISEAFEELKTDKTVFDEETMHLNSKSELAKPFIVPDDTSLEFEKKDTKLQQFKSLSESQLDDVQDETFKTMQSFSLQIPLIEQYYNQQYRREKLVEPELLSDINMLANITISKALEELQTEDIFHDEGIINLDSKGELPDISTIMDYTYIISEEEFSKDIYNSQLTIREIISEDFFHKSIQGKSDSIIEGKSKTKDISMGLDYVPLEKTPLQSKDADIHHIREKDEDAVFSKRENSINAIAQIRTSVPLNKIDQTDVLAGFFGSATISSEQNYVAILHDEEENDTVEREAKTSKYTITHISTSENLGISPDGGWANFYGSASITPDQNIVDTKEKYVLSTDSDNQLGKSQLISGIVTTSKQNILKRSDISILSTSVTDSKSKIEYIEDAVSMLARNTIAGALYDLNLDENLHQQNLHSDSTVLISDRLTTQDDNLSVYSRVDQWRRACAEAQGTEQEFAFTKGNLSFLYPVGIDVSATSDDYTDALSTELDVSIISDENVTDLTSLKYETDQKYSSDYKLQKAEAGKIESSTKELSHKSTRVNDIIRACSRVDKWRRTSAKMEETDQEFAFPKGNISFLYTPEIDVSATSDEYTDALSTERDVSIISDENVTDLTSLKYETDQKYSSDYKLQKAEKIDSSTKELSHKSTRVNNIIRASSRVDKWRRTSAKMEETDQEFAFPKGNISFLYTPEIDVSATSDEYTDALSTERDVSIISDENVTDLTSLKYETDQKYSSDYKLQKAEKIESSTKELSHKSTRVNNIIRASSRVDKWRRTSAKMEETDQEFAFPKGNISFLYTPEIDVSATSDEYTDALSTERDVSIISDENVTDLTSLKYETDQKYSSDYKLQKAEKIDSSTKELSHKSTRVNNIIRASSRVDKWRRTSAKMEETDQEFAFPKGNISFLYTPEIDVSATSDEYTDALSTELDVSIISDENVTDSTSLKYETDQKYSSDYKLQKAEKIESSTKELSHKSTRVNNIIRASSRVDKWRRTSAKMEETDQEFAFPKGNISFLYTPEIDVSATSDEYTDALSTERDVSIISDENVTDLTSLKYETDQKYSSDYKLQKADAGKSESSTKELSHKSTRVNNIIRASSRVDKWRRTSAKMEETDQEFAFPKGNISFLYTPEIDVSATSDEYTDALSTERDVSIISDENVTDLTSLKYETDQKYSSDYKLQKADAGKSESSTKELSHKSTRVNNIIRASSRVDKWRRTSAKMEETDQEFAFPKGNISFLYTPEIDVSTISDEYTDALSTERDVSITSDDNIADLTSMKYESDQTYSSVYKFQKVEMRKPEISGKRVYATADLNRRVSSTSDVKENEEREKERNINLAEITELVTDVIVNAKQSEQTLSTGIRTREDYVTLNTCSKVDKWRRACAELKEQEYVFARENFSFLYQSEVGDSASSDENYTDALSSEMEVSITTDKNVTDLTSVKYGSEEKYSSVNKLPKAKMEETEITTREVDATGELSVSLTSGEKKLGEKRKGEKAINLVQRIEPVVNLNLNTEQNISPSLKGTKQEFLFSEGNLSFLYQKGTDFYAYSDENYTDALSTERDISVTSDEDDADLISLKYGTDQKSSQNKFQKAVTAKTESSSKDLSHRSTTKVYDNLSSYSRIDKWRRECAEAEAAGKEFFYYLSFLYPSEVDFSASSEDYSDALSTAMDASVTSDEIVPPWKCEIEQKPISLYKESKISGDEVRSTNLIPSLSKELDVHHIGEKDKDSAVSKTKESTINAIAQIHTSVSLNKINERDGQAGFFGSATISSEQNNVAILHDEEENDTVEREAKTSKYTITHISTSENLGISPDGAWANFYGSASITPDQNIVDTKEKYVLSTDSDNQLGKAQLISGIVTTSKQNLLKRSDISILSISVASSKNKSEDIEEAVSMLARNTIAEAFYDLNLDENWLQENVNADSISVADKMVKPYVCNQTPSISTHFLNELNSRFNLVAKEAEQSLPPGAALQQNFPVVSAYNKDYEIHKGCEEAEIRDLQYVFAKENFSFLYSTDSDISVTFNADRSDLSSTTTDDYRTPEGSFTDLASLNYSSDPKYSSLFRFSKAGTSLEYNNNVTLKPSSVEEGCFTEYYRPIQDKDSSTANFINRSKHKESEVLVTKNLINNIDSEKKMHSDLNSSPSISSDQLQNENLNQSLALDSSKTVGKGTESFLSIETQEITSAVQLLASLTISDAFSELEQETFEFKSSRSSNL